MGAILAFFLFEISVLASIPGPLAHYSPLTHYLCAIAGKNVYAGKFARIAYKRRYCVKWSRGYCLRRTTKIHRVLVQCNHPGIDSKWGVIAVSEDRFNRCKTLAKGWTKKDVTMNQVAN